MSKLIIADSLQNQYAPLINKSQGISLNFFVSQFLTEHGEFDRMAEKLGIVAPSPLSLKSLLTLISNEEIEELEAIGSSPDRA